MRDSLKARMAAILVASGLLVAGPGLLATGAQGQTNTCVPTNLVGGIGNDTGNGSESEFETECSAQGTTISQSGNNSNVGIQLGNLGIALCGSGDGHIGPNICPVVNGDVDQEQEQNAGHEAESYTGKNGKKGKKSSKKKKKKKSKKKK